MITTSPEVDLETFRRYAGLSLPRHVSYPMPSWWSPLDPMEIVSMRQASDRRAPPRDLSLYLHIPFCEALCKFCACNRVILRKSAAGADQRVDAYLAALIRELRQLSATVGSQRRVRQIHWGGGTPTYLSTAQVERLHCAVEERFPVSDDAEIAMEIDPRVTTVEMLRTLRQLGFNRLSMGVQDFDPKVQEHVRRIQPFELVREFVAACRDWGFESLNFDLIYGMPYQTVETIRDTVERAITLSPDRVAFYHYAQIPEKIATQRGIDHTKLPDSETKLGMFLIALRLFESGGYEFIGLDHFAQPDEALAVARRNGTLQRNFQGMTTGEGLDLQGVGASSITHLLDVGFLQNVKDPDGYVERIENGCSPIERGMRLRFDDRVRQAVIQHLYCQAEIRSALIESQFGIVFAEYFRRELDVITELEQDGLVVKEPSGVVKVTMPLGRVLLRNVAAVFDSYLNPDAYRCGEQACFSMNA
jgi:oxygen-independent coproporphyrinogen-3 oxidase